MTDYYCELGEDFNDERGDDPSGAIAYTGPGGFQAAIRGTGQATALAAGDTIYLQGTADLSKLVLLDCGKDISGWALEDIVVDDNGGMTWGGVICEVSVAADNTYILVQLNNDSTEINYDDIDIGDGINNLSQPDTTSLVSKACPGIQLADVNGDTTDGSIKYIGVNADWVQDYTTQAVLDGNSQAAGCLSDANDVDYYILENITFTLAAGDGLSMGTTFQSEYLILRRCIALSNTGMGFHLFQTEYPTLIECIAKSNTSDGIRPAENARIIFCRSEDNSYGLQLRGGSGNFIYGNAFIANTLKGIEMRSASHGNCVIGNVIDQVSGNSGIGANNPSNIELVLCNRITNVPDTYYGIDWGTSGVYDAFIEDWNVFYNPAATGDLRNVTSGRNSYGIESNHLTNPDGDDGYAVGTFNVADGKAHDSTEINLYWDS